MMLQVKHLKFAYQPDKPILEDISFELEAGEVLSILGRNGVGKSTLIQCLLHLLDLSSGQVQLMDQNIKTMGPRAIAARVGYVPQAHRLVFPFSVFEFVLMGRAPHVAIYSTPQKKDYLITEQALERIGIGHLANKSITELSGGERQMVMIARSIAQSPRLLIFDEPTSHLDLANQLRVLSVVEMLAQDGIGIIMSTHFPDHGFLLSQRIAIMRQGRFTAEGRAEEVLVPSNLKEAYGVDIDVCYVRQADRRVCIPRRNSRTTEPFF